MSAKDVMINSVANEMGWAYGEVGWLSPEDAAKAQKERDDLLARIRGKVNSQFCDNKIFTGSLSAGCRCCGEGKWSCFFLTHKCTASCFFCPQSESQRENPSNAHGIIFNSPQSYVSFLERFGFRGVGFSGGDPLADMDLLLRYIEAIRKKLGEEIYVWVYTNGLLIDDDKMRALKDASIDEIRLDIAAAGYGTKAVGKASKYIDKVAVEVPAIPEDERRLRGAIEKFFDVGVNYLNLHQLEVTSANYREFLKRGYTFLRNEGISVLESEFSALETVAFMLDRGMEVPVNYCSAAYKSRVQAAGVRRRFASSIARPYESVTEAGYLRYAFLEAGRAAADKLIGDFKCSGVKDGLWKYDVDSEMFLVHSSLLGRFMSSEIAAAPSLVYCELKPLQGKSTENDDVEIVQIDSDLTVSFRRVFYFLDYLEGDLLKVAADRFENADERRIAENEFPPSKGAMALEEAFDEYEKVRGGWPEIF